MKKIIAMLFLCQQANAQTRGLTVGDTLPDLVLKNAVNYAAGTEIHLSDLAGKIILLDFWATWCGSCVSGMPEMAALQKNMGGSVQVVYVTPQDKETVKRFYGKREELRSLGLPIITGDSLLMGMFPCRAVPHVVWIGTDREVKAITEAGYVRETNLRKLLAGNRIGLPVKRDVMDFDYSKTFYLPEKGLRGLLAQSTLTGHMEGLQGYDGFSNPDTGTCRIYATNSGLVSLYLQSVSLVFEPPPTGAVQRLLVESERKWLFEKSPGLDQSADTYCYEAVIRGKGTLRERKLLSRRMQADLDQAFGFSSAVERRRTACYVISPQEQGNTFTNAGVSPGEEIPMVTGTALPASIHACLDTRLPVVFEGPASFSAPVRLKEKYQSVASLAADLRKAGLVFNREERDLDMLVIRDAER